MKPTINKKDKDEIQKTEDLIGDSRIGTFLLAVIKLIEPGNNARYKEISKLVFTADDDNKSAKLNHYIKLFKDEGLKIVFFDSNDECREKVFKPISKDKDGKYTYEEEEVINLFSWVAYYLNYKYYDKDYSQILNDEVKKSILKYLINFANEEVDWKVCDRYSLADIFACMEEDLIMLYYENLLNKDRLNQKLTPSLEKWAKQLIEDFIKNSTDRNTKKINNNFVR